MNLTFSHPSIFLSGGANLSRTAYDFLKQKARVNVGGKEKEVEGYR